MPGVMRPRWLAAPLLVASLVTGQSPALGQPGQLSRHSAIYDAARDRMVVFGGYDEVDARSESWALALADTPRWDPVIPVGTAPPSRFGHAAVYDPAGDRMIVLGGWNGGPLDDVWALSLTSPRSWQELHPSGTPPPARAYHSAIYDPLRKRVLIYGGSGLSSFRDTWELSLGDTMRWNRLRQAPITRQSHSAIYDPLRDRMIVFGGFGLANDVYELTFADTVWKEIRPAGIAPRPRQGHSAVYDPVGDRMIVFGGHDGTAPRDSLWQLSLANPPTWSPLVPVGGPPAGRYLHAAVYDSSCRCMLVFGGWNGTSLADTWALSLGPTPAWSPARPVLAVSSTSLQLPAVTVGDTVRVPFSIANMGLEALHISAINLPLPPPASSAEFRLSAPAPFKLSWNETAAETLFLAGSLPRNIQDSLVIVSNDSLAARKRVTLDTHVLGLDFQSRILGSPVEVPLGVSVIVVVTPEAGVRIEHGTLFYRIAGGVASFDSLALTPLATDFIAAIPADAVTDRGVEYYVKVENSGFMSTQPPGAPADSVFTQSVAPATSMTAVPRASSGSDFLVGREFQVEALLPTGASFDSGRIHYRQGGETTYESDTLTTGILGRPIATIPARVVGPRGVEYWVGVRTRGSQLRFPATASQFAVVPTKTPNLVEPRYHPGGRYRLLSVPLDFGADFSASLNGILADQLGRYDPVHWRSYWYDPGTQRNLEFSVASSSSFRPKPGRAFWLISRESHRVDTAPIDGFSTPTAGPYPIVLAPGWNQLGNPFDFPVSWSEVARDSASVGNPVAFDPALGTRGDYSNTVPTVLAPFEGYFVENTGAQPETLWVPAHAASVVTAAPPEGDLHGVPGLWSLRLGATTEQATDGTKEFGLDRRAADDLDPLDLREPPVPPGPWVQLAFPHREWDRKPGLYRRDLRAPGSEGQTWEIELSSVTAGEPVTLELSATAPLPPDLVVLLLDREQGSVTEVHRGAAPIPSLIQEPQADGIRVAGYRLLSFGPRRPYRLAIIAGTEAYATRASHQARLAPARLALDQNEPNPFRTATRFRFGLPGEERVTLEIYNVLGQRVTSLLDGARLPAGYHTLVWDGRTSGTNSAPTGVYFCRLAAGGSVRTRRVVLVR